MSKNGFGQMYRKLSSKVLDLVVSPKVLGDVPTEPKTDTQTPTATQKIVCYVLQNHSRSNALVVDGETRRLKLPAALDPMPLGNSTEKASVVFLQYHDDSYSLTTPPHAFPPRLLRLIDALEQNPELRLTSFQ